MAIQKQQFYEGAALHLLAQSGKVQAMRYEAPFFTFNEASKVLLKYCTRKRSPWGFTFVAQEQQQMVSVAAHESLIIGLVCGSDGVVALPYDRFCEIASVRETALRVACFRQHGEYYEVSGPDGVLTRKIAPSEWKRILDANEEEVE